MSTIRIKAKQYSGFIFIVPSLIGVSIFVLIPFVDVIRRSFMNVLGTEMVGFRNYVTVFNNVAFRLAATNTFRFLIICIPILLILSLAISVIIHQQSRHGHFIKMAFLMPMAIPVVSVVVIWQLLFDRSGMINGLLATLGFSTINWMGSDSAFWVLVFSYIWRNMGYNIVLWVAGLSCIPSSIYEAAKVDGANEWQLFFRITLPNLKKIAATITILSLLNSFRVFREAYLVAGEYPHPSMYLLQHTFQNWYRDLALDRLSAGAVMMTIVITLLVLQFKKGLFD
jgi:multiple sugar transport system permease protein